MLVTAGCNNGGGKVAIEAGSEKITMNDLSVFLTAGDGFEQSKKQYAELMEETMKYGELGKAMGIDLTDEQKESITTSKASFAQSHGGLSACKEYLKKAGSSMEFVEKLFTANAYQTALSEQIDAEFEGIIPTENEKKEYFLENYYRAKHILINLEEEEEDAADAAAADDSLTIEAEEDAEPTPITKDEDGNTGEALANAILEKAKAGEDFDELIKLYNQDPGMASNEDGYIFKDGDMVDEFYECVKSLEPGEFGICKSTYGYHIIQRLPFSESEEKFATWYENNEAAVGSALEDKMRDDRFEEMCKEHNITSTIHWDVVDAFNEDMLVPTSE